MNINDKLIEKAKTKALTIFDVMHSFLYTMKYMHKFFKGASPNFMEGYSKWHYVTNYPKAYTSFMSLSFKDWKKWLKEIRRCSNGCQHWL